jgi:hypothetical protein
MMTMEMTMNKMTVVVANGKRFERFEVISLGFKPLSIKRLDNGEIIPTACGLGKQVLRAWRRQKAQSNLTNLQAFQLYTK